MTDAWHLAIDFGTSNTSAAHTSPLSGAIETLALTHRSNLLPSAVYWAGDGIASGENALMQGRKDPANLMLSPKRYIDHDVVQLGGREVQELDLVAAVLRNAIEQAKAQHSGVAPATVTLTHPEAWSAHSLGQLLAAGRRAGLVDAQIRTISEPRAAAMHYAAQQEIPSGKHVAVFDFGGGTLDIAVLQAQQDGNFRVVAAKGDNSLGGRTVDNLMYRWVIAQLEFDDPDFADYVKTAPVSVMHALESSVREAKEVLSDASSATITVSTPQGERDILLTRDEFNNIIEESVTRGVELTRAALEQAGVNGSDTPLYLTGGSSRIPHVQNRLAEVGMVERLDDPKTVVSRGALRATMHGFSAGSDGSTTAAQPAVNPAATTTEQFSKPQSDPYANPYANPPREATASPTSGQPSAKKASMVNFNSATPKSGSGFKKWLYAGIAAVVVLGAGAMIVPNMLGGQETFQVSPQMDEKHLARVDSKTAEIMPAAFLEKIDYCNNPSKSYSSLDWAKDKESRSCRFVKDLPAAPANTGYYTNNFDVFQGATAKDVYEAMKNSDSTKREFQKAKGNRPEVVAVEQNKYTAIAVWYEKDEYLVFFDEYAQPTDNEVAQWGQYFGFLKK
ncbi:Chaperone protein HscA [Corynebacterium kalinowskii]|uniref:Chaperone protein HscA n=1 Tax=Corynebacterium kalinowskii TaxID=2675216 RepID=A0A6B8VEA4_9CORY|nr:Hsp70 family protein [Corynebacterium kalinowskii]QGU01399.1 Chaperone protein HscA [Corynebacterium kalinowskii]